MYVPDVDHIASQRLTPYLSHAHGDPNRAMELYLLDRKLSAAVFFEIGIVEVALRNAIDRALVGKYGPDWPGNMALPVDRRTTENICEAWAQLPGSFTRERCTSGTMSGRLLAANMFRTWSNLPDEGTTTGLAAPRDRADHDLIWDRPTLLAAFPGSSLEAGGQGVQLTRKWVFDVVKEVHVLRNRIAHHEALINGYPMPGMKDPSGHPVRRSIEEGVAACRTLARIIDHHLEEFLTNDSTAEKALADLRSAAHA